MDSLANYGSDDDYDDSSDEKKTDWRTATSANMKQQRFASSSGKQNEGDANYEEVQMDLSEESNSSTERPTKPQSSSSSTTTETRESSSSSSRNHRRSREKDERNKRSSRDDESHSFSSSRRKETDRERDRDDYYRRDRDRERDRYRRRDDERGERDRHRDERRRGSRRSSSRERQRNGGSSRSRSRSPRRSSEYNRGGRERGGKGNGNGGYATSKKYERTSNKMAHLEKLGIEIKTPDCQFVTPSDLQRSMEDQRRENNRNTSSIGTTASSTLAGGAAAAAATVGTGSTANGFFMPGITGHFRDQIEKRKLLWQKKQPEEKKKVVENVQEVCTSTSSRTTKVWETVNFAQDQDGKVASKFKRLMGIKGQTDAKPSATDVLKKQEEMFSSMEAQYEVARTATHTMRGVGLGFGSFQR